MKIALVSPYDYPYPGGVTSHITMLAEHLRKLGHAVTIMAPSSSDEQVVARLGMIQFGRVVPVPGNGSIARITLSVSVSSEVRETLDREAFDVIHLHEPMVPLLPLLVLLHSNTVNIGTFHAYSHEASPYKLATPFMQPFADRLHGRIAVSAAAQRFASSLLPGDYRIIPNGIDFERFSRPAAPLPEYADSTLNVLFVGRLEPRKGLEHLIRAMAILSPLMPTTRLLVVGAYNREAQAPYEELAQGLGLENVVFVGPVSQADLPRYYQAADVVAVPSTGGESFGMVLLEAMAAAKPVVASDIEGYRQLVEPAREGLLAPPKDEASLAVALTRLLADPGLRAKLGANGRRKAETYSWPTITRRVLDYYEEVLAEFKSCVY